MKNTMKPQPKKKATKAVKAGKLTLVGTKKSNNIFDALGIPEKRVQVLCNELEKINEKNSQISDSLYKISKVCENQNELSWISYHLGTAIEKSKNPLADLLG